MLEEIKTQTKREPRRSFKKVRQYSTVCSRICPNSKVVEHFPKIDNFSFARPTEVSLFFDNPDGDRKNSDNRFERTKMAFVCINPKAPPVDQSALVSETQVPNGFRICRLCVAKNNDNINTNADAVDIKPIKVT